MTASEKLRALDGAMTASYNRTLVPMDDGYYSSREISRLRAALPLIADCIEAAEAGEDALRIHGRGPELITARHALYSSLARLREHLEGGNE